MIQTLTDLAQLSYSHKLIMYFVSAENSGWKQNRFSFQSRHQWGFISEKYANLISNNYRVHSARSAGESVTFTDYVHRTNQNLK